MIKLTIPNIEIEVKDLEQVREKALEAARAKARVKGGRRGENLIGIDEVAAEAAVKEIERQGGLVKPKT